MSLFQNPFLLFLLLSCMPSLPPLPIDVGMQNSDPGENYNIERGTGGGLEHHIKPIVIMTSKFVIWQCEMLEPPQQFLSPIVAWEFSPSSKKSTSSKKANCFVLHGRMSVCYVSRSPRFKLNVSPGCELDLNFFLITSFTSMPPAVSLANRCHK